MRLVAFILIISIPLLLVAARINFHLRWWRTSMEGEEAVSLSRGEVIQATIVVLLQVFLGAFMLTRDEPSGITWFFLFLGALYLFVLSLKRRG
jgi:hypothetical protein